MTRKWASCVLLVISLSQVVTAQQCISLQDSKQCAAFNASSISTSTFNIGLFPFLSSVSDTSSFDSNLQSYISGYFIQDRFKQLIGCTAFNATNPSVYYARYTTSVLCNAIIQNSLQDCSLSGNSARPLCADTCALYAQNEQSIASSRACGNQGPNADSQIRADLVNCALPDQAIHGTCITGVSNEPNDCSFGNNQAGLCAYCSAGSPNATDSCCVFADTQTRCQGVNLAIVAAPSFSLVSTTSPTSTATASSSSSTNLSSSSNIASPVDRPKTGLTGGQIAAIVIGTILGALLLLGLLLLTCILIRRRRRKAISNRPAAIFNQPAVARQTSTRTSVIGGRNDGASSLSDKVPEKPSGEPLPGGRIARFVALEPSDTQNHLPILPPPFVAQSRPLPNHPISNARLQMGLQPRKPRSIPLMADRSANRPIVDEESSPAGTNSSERLNYFKDYYSEDEINTGDLVSTLWAYQPRAQDEFELERGDMLVVVGIWDDGWATGKRVSIRAEDWTPSSAIKARRRSTLSTGSSDSDNHDSEIKAFPLVCVCLPNQWRRTIDGEVHEFTENQIA